MGWDGVCIFDERVDGHWFKFTEIDVQHIVYRVAGSMHADFVAIEDQGRDDSATGEFQWSALVAADDEQLDNGQFRDVSEIYERMNSNGHQELVLALQDSSRTFRACCIINC